MSEEHDKLAKTIVKEFKAVLDDRRSVSEDTHRAHHAFLDSWISREQRKQERWEKVRTQVTGWGVLAVLSSVFTAVYHYFFKNGGTH